MLLRVQRPAAGDDRGLIRFAKDALQPEGEMLKALLRWKDLD